MEPQRGMRVVVTNDDGVESPGIAELAAAIRDRGYAVSVVAPDCDHSGMGAAIGPLHLTGRIEFERRPLPDLEDVAVLAVDGPPALAVFAACLSGFGPPPDVVVSGINKGANTGRAVLHSGTVGAALTALNFGVRALAVSQEVGEPQRWRTAARVAGSLLPWVASAPEPLVLNVNVPNLSRREIAGVAVARLATGGVVQAALEETTEEVLELRMPSSRPPEPGTDTAVLATGRISLTPLAGIAMADAYLETAVRAVATVLNEGARVA